MSSDGSTDDQPQEMDRQDRQGRYNIQAVDRAVKALELLSQGDALKLDALSGQLGISTSSTYRLLATLQSHRYVEKDDNQGGYRLGLACLELARSFSAANDIRSTAMSELNRLRDGTRETVHLGVLEGMEVVYLEKRHGLHPIGLMSSRVGGRSPAYCTGLGKVLLAYQTPEEVRDHFQARGLSEFTDRTITDLDELMDRLSEIRRQGYGLDLGEHEAEVRCVAAPVFDDGGRAVAAISISGPASRLGDLDDQPELIQRTTDAARAISRRFGYISTDK